MVVSTRGRSVVECQLTKMVWQRPHLPFGVLHPCVWSPPGKPGGGGGAAGRRRGRVRSTNVSSGVGPERADGRPAGGQLRWPVPSVRRAGQRHSWQQCRHGDRPMRLPAATVAVRGAPAAAEELRQPPRERQLLRSSVSLPESSSC